MAKKREVCKKTKKFMDDPNHKDHKAVQGTTTSWKGRIFITDAEKSFIASQIGMNHNGEYAIKVR